MSDPSLDALARLAAAAQAMADGACTCPTYAAWSPGCARSDCPCHGEHVPRAPDLARGLVAAVDALRAERDQRDRMIASFGRLDMSAAELGNIVVAMRAKLDAAEAQRDALVAAAREERAAREREVTIANEPRSARTGEEWSAAYLAATKATDAARAVVTALLSGAPADVVRAGVVREYLDAEERWREGIGAYLPGEDVTAYVARRDAERMRVGELHKAMVAALAAAEGR